MLKEATNDASLNAFRTIWERDLNLTLEKEKRDF